MSEETYERAGEPDRDSDYQCMACGEWCGSTFCGECEALRQKEHENIEESLRAAIQWAHEAHDARWDVDTTQTRRRLADSLRKEMAVAYRLATGDVL